MSHATLARYHRQLASLDCTRNRMESLFANGAIVLRDVHSVYESLFLRAVTGFEAFCEALFFEIINGQTRYAKRKVECKINCISSKATREIVLQGDRYLDWLPFHKTDDRIALYFIRRGGPTNLGRPFFDLTSGERSQIKTIVTIRHAIAHSSEHAYREFEKTVIGTQALLTNERTPAGFLRSQISHAPVQRRFEVYLANLASISQNILGKPMT